MNDISEKLARLASWIENTRGDEYMAVLLREAITTIEDYERLHWRRRGEREAS